VGWRFRSRIGLGRFARLNFSKSGLSLGLGPRGLNINIGPKGVRTTVGLPGTGLSYQTFESWRQRGRPATSPLKTIFGWVTDKELNRYTRDFDREAEAVGMLIKLNERRKAS
jgi:hypothetical protein